MDRGRCVQKEKNPRATTNIISFISFFYIIKLLKKGFVKSLEFEDLYEVLDECQSKKLGDKLEQKWKEEKIKHKKPSLCRTLFICFGKTFFKLGLIQLVVRLTMTIWSPYAKSKLISYFNPAQIELSKNDAIYHGSVVIGLNVINVFFSHNFSLYVLALGLSVKAAVSTLLYRKALKLKCEALSEVTVGKITTIINRDVEIFQQFVSQGNNIWIAIIQTVLICYLIYNKIGVASWTGVTFFFLVLPLQMLIANLAYKYRLKCSKTTDNRLEVTQEVLSAIKVIKMFTWEKYFEKKICDSRKYELKEMHLLFYSRVWIGVIGSLCSKIAFFIFIVSYVWMEENVTAEKVFYILSCFGDLQNSLSQSFPSGLSKAAEVYAVIKRCENILYCKEIAPKVEATEIMCRNILFSGVDAKIGSDTILKNVSLNISKGLNVVIGHVGSGKSTFLKAILHDCETIGCVKISGTISYASQDPWLFPSTIKNNILFGEEYLENRYERILKTCSLDYDLELIEGGDSTIVGERGINLSKGQQARINLARALYKKADIYLLDDCLASLDAHVSDHIFKECIQKFLKNRVCFFVTNNPHYIKEADNIISIEDGLVNCAKNFNKKISLKYFKYEIDRSAPIEETGDKVPVYTETKNSGKVSLNDYYEYVSYGGGIIVFLLIMALFTTYQAVSSYATKLLSNWVTLEQNVSNHKINNQSYTKEYQELYQKRTDNLTWYYGMFSADTVLFLICIFSYFYFIRTASKNLHKVMLKAVMNSTMSFFDTHYIGNILTRFSKDFVTIDEYLPFVLIECLLMIFGVLGGIILLTTVKITFLLEVLILLIIGYVIKRICQPTLRNLQRLHIMARCPMVGHVTSTLTGLSTIRANNAEKMIKDEYDKYQDQFTSNHFMMDNTLVALSFSLEFLCAIFVASIIIQFLVATYEPNVGDVGLVITQAFTVSELLSSGIKVIADTENLMTSAERILEYVRLKQETQDVKKLDNWPKSGVVNFKNVSLQYGTSKKILRNISFDINAKEKLGVVGRTGAGKSSLVSSLLRLYQIEGSIIIDNIDINDVSLDCLRNSISVIPQDPFLFSGTIRENLDPLLQHSDDEIWKILESLHLKSLITDLNAKVDQGSTMSAGQKQLLCLTRVILRKNKIVILDEANSNVDSETDDIIQEAVVKYFSNCTVIIIAHKIVSVLDCDKVIVMTDGEISEYDEPKMLMDNKNSFFHQSVVK